jgi:Transmembrane domain of unknown function (DUF3566)
VTARDEIGRPVPSSDVHNDVPTTIDHGVDISGNGGPRYGAVPDQGARRSHASSKASTAYEVAAALRAQASRAAQATREAGRRVQDALSTQPDPGAVVTNSVPRPADTPTAAAAVAAAASAPPTQRRHAPSQPVDFEIGGSDAPVGAAAALAATAPAPPSRPREVPAAGPETSIEPPATQPVDEYPVHVRTQPAPEYLAEPPAGAEAAEEYRADVHVSDPPQSALTEVSDPAAVPPDAAIPDDDLAPEAAALAPVVAPVIVPATEPGSLSRAAAGLVEPIETQVSVDARPEATQLAPPPVPRPATTIRRTGRVRKARLRLMRVDPWSVMKTAFLLSVALGITMFVAVAVLWSVLDAAGVFSSVGRLIQDLTSSETNAGFQLENYTALSRVLGFTTLIAVVDVVLVTALATLGAFLYNLSASLLGGLEVTLAEDD